MRVFWVLGTLFIVAAIYLLFFTDRDTAAMLFLVTGSGLVTADHRRRR